MMAPIRLTNSQLHEIRQAAQTVPYDLRGVFLERVAAELRGQDILVTVSCVAWLMRSRAQSHGTPSRQ